MARTNADAVKLVLRLGSQGGDYDDRANPSLDPYIDWATEIVSDVAACASSMHGVTHSSTKLEKMERWLAAHAYAMSDQTYASKSTLDASASFHGQTGLGLDGTKYGQMAKSLDRTGCLAALTSAEGPKVAGITWLGKAPSEQTPHWDRD